MHFIHNTHLLCLPELGSVAAPALLFVLTQSGSSPWVKDTDRFPVFLGAGAKEIAERLSLSVATVRRGMSRLRSVLDENEGGRFLPRCDALPDPWVTGPRDTEDNPLYVQLSNACVRNLLQLPLQVAELRERGGEEWKSRLDSRSAFSAFSLACVLLPRFRWCRAMGRKHTVMTTDEACNLTGMGRRGVITGFRVLKALGYIVEAKTDKRYRKMKTIAGILGSVPTRKERDTPTAHANEPQTITKAPQTITKAPTVSKANLEQENRPTTHAGGLVGWFLSCELLPALSVQSARLLAAACENEEEAFRWVDSERDVLTSKSVRSPSGLFVSMFKSGKTAPGKPSRPPRRFTDGIAPNPFTNSNTIPTQFQNAPPATEVHIDQQVEDALPALLDARREAVELSEKIVPSAGLEEGHVSQRLAWFANNAWDLLVRAQVGEAAQHLQDQVQSIYLEAMEMEGTRKDAVRRLSEAAKAERREEEERERASQNARNKEHAQRLRAMLRGQNAGKDIRPAASTSATSPRRS